MPLNPKSSTGTMIRELHTGKTYSRTKRKYGKKKADKQAVAIALAEKRRHGGKKSVKSSKRKKSSRRHARR